MNETAQFDNSISNIQEEPESSLTQSEYIKDLHNTEPKYCCIYLVIVSFIFVIFGINLSFTINTFDENRIIQLSPEIICKGLINDWNICLNKNDNNTNNQTLEESKCAFQRKHTQKCYDNISNLNKKCFMYLSEIDLCVKNSIDLNIKNKSLLSDTLIEKCSNYIDDVEKCSNSSLEIDVHLLISSIGN
jgi:hypothetical protein